MPSTLFATAFQTPGRRAFGRVCELPEGFAWAKKEMGGKIVAAGVVMNFTEEVRAPVFLMATTKLSGKAVTSLMLVVAFVYPEDNPGIVVSLGFHGLTHDWMQKFYGKMLAPATLRRARERWPEATVMAEWPEAVNLSRCEHGAVVERWAAPPAPGRVEKDQNLHHIPAVLHRDGWYLKISELTAEWEMPQLLARLAGSVQALPAGVRAALAGALQPPSGLVPLERDFEPVADDVVRFRSSMLLIGGSPTSPLPALRIAADGTLGWLQRRPFDGEDFFTLKKLRRLNHSDVASLLPTDMPSRTWGRSPSSEVVLADQVCRVPFDLIPNGKDGRPEQVIITNNSMRHRFKLSYDSVYQLQLLQRTSSRGGGGQGSGDSEMQLGPLQPLLEPTTPAHCVRELCRLFEEGNGGWAANAHTARTLRNEMQVQITPESDAQKVLSDARVRVRAYEYPRLAALLRAAGVELEWIGDRSLTLIYYMKDLDEFCRIFQMEHAGWRVPEKEPTANGAKRRRLFRYLGYMLVFMHNDVDDRGSNFIRYCMETRVLEIGLSVGFFDETLDWSGKGASPPPQEAKFRGKGQYDIVTRTWRSAYATPTRTTDRADKHFIQDLVFD